MKLLLLDLELAPNQALVWGMFGVYIKPNQVMGDSYVLSWAAKWHGEEEVTYSSLGMTNKRSMLREIYNLMNEADVIVTYNGDRFDLKILNQEFMLQGWNPPRPYRSIDLLKTMKKNFRGIFNKLDYWLKKLELGQKVENRGMQLWIDCMNKDPDAFLEMEEYNIGDVIELEKLYDRVKPWITNLPNLSVLTRSCVCPVCGTSKLQSRGFTITNHRRYCCENGHWSQSATVERVPKYNKLKSITR